jgi:hypothetical protein
MCGKRTQSATSQIWGVYIKPANERFSHLDLSQQPIELAILPAAGGTPIIQCTSMATCGSPVLALASQDEDLLQRKPRPYIPSIWGDFFLKHQPGTPSQVHTLISIIDKKENRQGVCV